MDIQNLKEIICLTIGVSGSALFFASIIGIPLGALLGLRNFPGKSLIKLLIYTGMGLPPVVAGLLVYLLLSHQGALRGLEWLFTPQGMILAQTLLAFPITAGLTASAVNEVSPQLRLQIRALGATPQQEQQAALWQARRGIIAAVLAAFGRIIAEVGAVMLVGGNIEGSTRVLSTAIVLETRQGNFEYALLLGSILLGLALLANFTLMALGKQWLRN